MAGSILLFTDDSWQALGMTFLLTLTNPATILSFITIFSGFGLSQTSSDYAHVIILVWVSHLDQPCGGCY